MLLQVHGSSLINQLWSPTKQQLTTTTATDDGYSSPKSDKDSESNVEEDESVAPKKQSQSVIYLFEDVDRHHFALCHHFATVELQLGNHFKIDCNLTTFDKSINQSIN